ncbi:type II toxin-antitoxin system VapC family toxin [Pseudorhodoplanes sp.]|uniref:type II toxin-antitoxin system VapC family toxin n=1 Tax=Pseudorhodoplanes sp. TaxID=1934341 RepID=UPI002C62E82B|nr:type II toxin-antitoxin system VapC family toxin [Pseudorhodoplanes sp.]HWV51223.1 type II toxin-antitoxin system VapC family toxin [Pseudorhodoplanes sp.]
MVIDTSALIALLRLESEAEAFAQAIEADPRRLVSAVTKLEARMVALGRFGAAAAADLDALIATIAPTVIPFDDHQADIARDAFARYGKGRHQASLNFGDCAAYALAVSEAEPLLFKGTDFAATDVERVAV